MCCFSFTVHSCHAEHGLGPEDPDADSVWCCSAKVKAKLSGLIHCSVVIMWISLCAMLLVMPIHNANVYLRAINDPHVLIHASWLLCIKGLVIVIFWYIKVTPIRSTQEHGAELKVRCCLVKLCVSQLLVQLLYFFTNRSLVSDQIIYNFL